MNNETFNLEEEQIKKEITKRKAKKVLIQLPEGLKKKGPHLAAAAEETGASAIVSADPCYGACDLPLQESQDLGIDLIIHYGHSEMLRQQGKVPIIYMEARAKINVKPAIKMAIPLLGSWKNIGLVTTVQHAHTLNEAKKLLQETGKKVKIRKAAGHVKYAGQVLGCDYSSATSISEEVDGFLYIGGGRFHAIGVTLATGKPTVVADPFEKRAYNIEAEAQRIIRQRWACISKAKKSKNFGVLIGLKTGQKNEKAALEIKKLLEKSNKKATLLALREITPEALMEFSTLDAFVNTACPRISLDNTSKFLKPVLTVNEALVMLNRISWEHLLTEGWFRRS